MIQRPRELRCPYCHDALAWQGSACPECATRYHFSCASELKSCALLGCRGRLDWPGKRAWPRSGRRADRLAAHLLCAGVSFAILALALALPALIEARKLGETTAVGSLKTIGVSCDWFRHKRGQCRCAELGATLDYGGLSDLLDQRTDPQEWILLSAALAAGR